MSEGSRLATGDARGRLVAIAGTAAAECAEAANSPVSSAPLGQDLGSMLAHAYGGSRTVRFGRNRDVVVAGDAHDCFYANHDGWLVRYKILHKGGRQIIDFVLPGDIFGLQACLFKRSLHSVVTVTPARLSCTL